MVALLITEKAYSALGPEITTYRKDVEKNFPVNLLILPGIWNTPEEVRDQIRTMHDERNISGVILVGALPMHRFHMHDFDNPNSLYYEDFDLQYKDTTGNGIPELYSGEPHLKLWVANMRAAENETEDDTETLRKFLNKTHEYYSGKMKIEKRALAITGNDWPDGADHFVQNVAIPLYGNENVDSIRANSVSKKTLLDKFSNHTYSMFYIQVHSNERRQDMQDDSITSREIEKMSTGALFVINHGCSTGNWMKAAANNNRNTAMSWVFGDGAGQAVVANVRVGMVYGQDSIYASILKGDYLGKAYFSGKKAAEAEMHHYYTSGDIVSGVTLIGNPFIYLHR
ncbi:hypothetical protein EG832_12640 [bacterium]|nr:hypothetical protein [bacterium]